MRRVLSSVICCALVVTFSGVLLHAAEAKAKPETKPEAKAEKPVTEGAPASHTVKREPFTVELTLKGMFEAQTAAEIAVRPVVWTALEVRSAVEHGATVKKGDVLVQFDLHKIDEELADLRLKQATSGLALKQAEENLKALEASTPLDLKQAERAQQMAREDRQQYLKVDRPLSERTAKFMLDLSKQSLEYEQEELRQLEKMYKADDLTEETEEIVLRRQRNAVKQAEFRLEMAKTNYEETMKYSIPRRDESIEQQTVRQDLTTEKAKVLLPLALGQARRDLEKLKLDRARNDEKLKKLKADRAAMTVKAPIAGTVYYGRFVRGKWSGMETVADTLRPGATVAKNAVVMTVVKPRPLAVRCSVPEADLHKVRPGIEGMIHPAGFPSVKLPVTLERLDPVPTGPDTFEARLSVALGKKAPPLVPGMNGTAKFIVYREEKALVVPAKALFSDDNETKQYVYLVGKNGKARKHAVTVGRRGDDRVEILKGLKEGDKVLLEKPQDAGSGGAGEKGSKGAEEKK